MYDIDNNDKKLMLEGKHGYSYFTISNGIICVSLT